MLLYFWSFFMCYRLETRSEYWNQFGSFISRWLCIQDECVWLILYSTFDYSLCSTTNCAEKKPMIKWLSHTNKTQTDDQIKQRTHTLCVTHAEWISLSQLRLYLCIDVIISFISSLSRFLIVFTFKWFVVVCVAYDTFFPFCNWTQSDYGDCIPKRFQSSNFHHRCRFAIDLITRPVLIIIQVAAAATTVIAVATLHFALFRLKSRFVANTVLISECMCLMIGGEWFS